MYKYTKIYHRLPWRYECLSYQASQLPLVEADQTEASIAKWLELWPQAEPQREANLGTAYSHMDFRAER